MDLGLDSSETFAFISSHSLRDASEMRLNTEMRLTRLEIV